MYTNMYTNMRINLINYFYFFLDLHEQEAYSAKIKARRALLCCGRNSNDSTCKPRCDTSRSETR